MMYLSDLRTVRYRIGATIQIVLVLSILIYAEKVTMPALYAPQIVERDVAGVLGCMGFWTTSRF